jgi:LacI family transcriptional regulator
MSSRTVTIRDVAEQAGVSQSMVSRVLNSSETRIPISQDTRQRVQRVAEELGYRAGCTRILRRARYFPGYLM